MATGGAGGHPGVPLAQALTLTLTDMATGGAGGHPGVHLVSPEYLPPGALLPRRALRSARVSQVTLTLEALQWDVQQDACGIAVGQLCGTAVGQQCGTAQWDCCGAALLWPWDSYVITMGQLRDRVLITKCGSLIADY